MADIPPPPPTQVSYSPIIMNGTPEPIEDISTINQHISDAITSIEPFHPPSLLVDKSPVNSADEKSTSSPTPINRPNIFGIGLKPNMGGFVMGINGANKLLKSSKRATTFVLKEGSKLYGNHQDWNITPKDRMRNIDELRKHVPTPEECDILNVPNDRLFVDNIKDVLYLSGGCAGVRFSSAELKSLQSLIANIKDLCKILEKTYLKLSPEQTKLNINPDSKEKIDRSQDIDNAADNVRVVYFHGVADDLTQLISQLQVIVHEKQKTIDKSASKMKFDDPDNLAGALPRPRWLDTLMVKCDAYLNPAAAITNADNSGGSSSSKSTSKKFLTKGKLAAFISYACTGVVPFSSDEQEALEDLIQASNDVKVQYNYGDNWSRVIAQQPREYWASRVLEFLKKVQEIKTMPTDEVSLLNFQLA